MPSIVIRDPEARFILGRKIGHLGTSDSVHEPHVMPICFALDRDMIYTPIDEKPKRTPNLKRARNVMETGRAAVLFDRYDDDWSQIGWVLVRGTASILHSGQEHCRAISLLRRRYLQYQNMSLETLPIIAIRAGRCTSWGNVE